MTEKYAKARGAAAKISADLRATDPRFKRSVIIRHRDGSVLLLRHAFCLSYRLEDTAFTLVFTEHLGGFVIADGDLKEIQQLIAEDIAELL